MTTLTAAEQLKFLVMGEGITVTERADRHLRQALGDRPLTSADYASTSGLILELDDDVWVNAPIVDHNANFVVAPQVMLDMDGGQLHVRGAGLASAARFWLPPAYHGRTNDLGEPYNSYAFTHTDRVRVSPVEGCAFTCKFCDLPYEFRYRTKRLDGLVEAVRRALDDPVQPAHHVLISGGTPRPDDYSYVRDAYEQIITGILPITTDVMMVPADDLLDARWLAGLGVQGLSVNLEIYNLDIGRKLMRRKHDQGRQHYLDYLADAATVLGPGRVRSMLMVGLEPMDDTLAGVRAIAERGCVPVLSPFRPDPSTPLRDTAPPTSSFMRETYLRSLEITREVGVPLGPECIPCSHNTLTLATRGNGDASVHYGHPAMI